MTLFRPSRGKTSSRGGPRALRSTTAHGHSGRLFVVVAVIVVLLTWGGLYVAFTRWRAHYRERVAYGASRVVSAASASKR